MSPEQLRMAGRSIVNYLETLNPKSDMYAFGMICYQVLFRMEPFQEHHLPKASKIFFLQNFRRKFNNFLWNIICPKPVKLFAFKIFEECSIIFSEKFLRKFRNCSWKYFQKLREFPLKLFLGKFFRSFRNCSRSFSNVPQKYLQV